MKLQGELIKCEDGVLLIQLEGFTPDLEIDKRYSIDIKKYKSQRSLEQNKMMWMIIHLISQATNNDEWDIYTSGLEKLNQKAEFILGLQEIEPRLKQAFRVVKNIDTRTINGKELQLYKCYYGSSKFKTDEMTKLVEYFINLAGELGIDISETEE